MGGVRRNRLQQVEQVQMQDRLGPLVGAIHGNVEPVPGGEPGALVTGE